MRRFYTHGIGQPPDVDDGFIEYEGSACDPLGMTFRISVDPTSDPEKWAGGAGLIDTGPTSILYVPSTSNVPSL